MDKAQIVHIVDDDAAIRDSLSILLKTSGLNPLTSPNAQAFLKHYDPTKSGCLVLDIHMPVMSGLNLQDELLAVGTTLPIIFITGHADVESAVQALKAGAFDFLQKPFDNTELLALIKQALEKDRKNRAALVKQKHIRDRLQTLTPREKEVLDHIVDAKATKVIAIEMTLSQRTIEIYRANIMQKMQCRSTAQLVRLISEYNCTTI